ncbi:hypothetical protein [Acinetobacter sp. ANC 3832]|uniref:hypothetical protein n=1 Tax=Acinetobacter sp. ANC 3832 TaxID=1977874 RepID=UPI00148A5DED|nr:hypothetical protein [Acinetobacter sp. ANC 3832]
MPKSITAIIKFVEAIMEKYGFWKVTSAILMGILIWQFSNIINAFATLAAVIK